MAEDEVTDLVQDVRESLTFAGVSILGAKPKDRTPLFLQQFYRNTQDGEAVPAAHLWEGSKDTFSVPSTCYLFARLLTI